MVRVLRRISVVVVPIHGRRTGRTASVRWRIVGKTDPFVIPARLRGWLDRLQHLQELAFARIERIEMTVRTWRHRAVEATYLRDAGCGRTGRESRERVPGPVPAGAGATRVHGLLLERVRGDEVVIKIDVVILERHIVAGRKGGARLQIAGDVRIGEVQPRKIVGVTLRSAERVSAVQRTAHLVFGTGAVACQQWGAAGARFGRARRIGHGDVVALAVERLVAERHAARELLQVALRMMKHDGGRAGKDRRGLPPGVVRVRRWRRIQPDQDKIDVGAPEHQRRPVRRLNVVARGRVAATGGVEKPVNAHRCRDRLYLLLGANPTGIVAVIGAHHVRDVRARLRDQQRRRADDDETVHYEYRLHDRARHIDQRRGRVGRAGDVALAVTRRSNVAK